LHFISSSHLPSIKKSLIPSDDRENKGLKKVKRFAIKIHRVLPIEILADRCKELIGSDTYGRFLFFYQNKKLPCTILQTNIHWAVQPSIKPFPKARYYSDSPSAIELWLSVPRSLGVWLYRITMFINIKQQ
jgi:hypothetical protein